MKFQQIIKGNFFELPYSNITFRDAIRAICEYAKVMKHQIVFTPNVQHFYLYKKDPEFRKAYENVCLSLVDGMPLVWAINLFQYDKIEKISGSDIFKEIFVLAVKANMKTFILGGMPGVAEAAIKNLGYSDLIDKKVFFYSPPVNFENSADNGNVIKMLNTIKPHILFVALGSPKQELWIYRNIKNINVGIAIGVGGSVDFTAGVQKRAPKLLQQMGLEWFYRLCKDPKRLWKRYLVTNLFFLPFFIRAIFLSIIRNMKILK